MVFCGKCGKDNPIGAKFCEDCGATLDEAPVQKQSQTTYASGNWLSHEHAGFLPRFVAAIIDGIILMVAAWILSIPFGISYLLGFELGNVGTLLLAIVSLLYLVYLDGLKGATIGKQLMKLRVISTNGEMPVGLLPGFLRWLIKIILPLFIISGLLILFDSQQQSLHDKIANTFVVKE